MVLSFLGINFFFFNLTSITPSLSAGLDKHLKQHLLELEYYIQHLKFLVVDLSALYYIVIFLNIILFEIKVFSKRFNML